MYLGKEGGGRLHFITDIFDICIFILKEHEFFIATIDLVKQWTIISEINTKIADVC